MPPKGSRRRGVATNAATAVVEDAMQNGTKSDFVANDIVEKPQPKLKGRPKKETTKAGGLTNGSLTDNSDLNGHVGDEPENEVTSDNPMTEEKPLEKRGRPKKVAKKDIKTVEESAPVNMEESIPETIDEEVEKDEPVEKRGRAKKGVKSNIQTVEESVPETVDEEVEKDEPVPKKRGGRVAKNTGRGRKKIPDEEQLADVPEEDNSAKVQKPAATRGRKPAAAVTEVKPRNLRARNGTTVQEPEVEETKVTRGRKRKNPEPIEEDHSEELEPEELQKAQNVHVSLVRRESIEKMALDLKSSDETNVKVAAGTSGRGRGRKRAADEEGSTSSSASKKGKGKATKPAKKEKIPDVDALDFKNESTNSGGDSWNLKIACWNVNGLRAWIEKDGMSYLTHEDPDILCIQETKCSEDKIPEEGNPLGYHCYWLSGDKDGYSGVGLMSKIKPKSVEYGINKKVHDSEGRVITAEYEDYYVVATYVPNAGRKLVRLDYRQQWDVDFRAYLKKLDKTKPVILCGDLNVAHQEIDLANPKTNKKNAGFTQEERDGFSSLLSEGFVDSFRHLYPDTKDAYTFWTYLSGARAKNVGWRLDYFVISERLTTNLCDCVIRKDVMGSDHCPLVLFLRI